MSQQVKAVTKKRYQLKQSDCGSQLVDVGAYLCEDVVVLEEPLQIWLNYYDPKCGNYLRKSLTITMRTPNNDCALVYGLLLAEGVITEISQVQSIVVGSDQLNIDQVNTDQPLVEANQIDVTLSAETKLDWRSLERQLASHSSCGLCGKSAVQALALNREKVTESEPLSVSVHEIIQLPNLLRAQQALFQQTGAVHGAGFYCNGEMKDVQEDVGRHNAVDKLIGQLLLSGENTSAGVLVLSGRVSFDLMQKAVLAGIEIIVAVGAPSSLALLVAQQFDLTLIGFTRTECFNVYHGHWRISE